MKLKRSDLIDEIENKLDGLTKRELIDLYNYLFPCKLIVHEEDIDWGKKPKLSPRHIDPAKINLDI